MQFSQSERRLAQILGKFPGIKKWLKRNYQRLNFYSHKKKYAYSSVYPVSCLQYQDEASFFGYYDKSPVNASGTHIIFHSIAEKNGVTGNNSVKIILHTIHTKENKCIAHSRAFNWQQGSRLQWLDDTRFSFSDIAENGEFCTRIFDSKQELEQANLSVPIYDHSDNIAVSLNFDRLQALRPEYGYARPSQKNLKLKAADEDGVFLVPMNGEASSLLISFEQIHTAFPLETPALNYKVNHLMLNGSATKCMFLYRWNYGAEWKHRLFVVNTDGNGLKLLNEALVSHCCWMDDTTILGYMSTKENSTPSYYKINVESGSIDQLARNLFEGLGDGHPGYRNGNVVLDTYPDKARMQGLYVYSLQDVKLEKVGEFLSPLSYREGWRCDLHPRWATDGSGIFFDSTHSGQRQLYFMNYSN